MHEYIYLRVDALMRRHTRRKNRVSYSCTIHYLTLFGKGNYTLSSRPGRSLPGTLAHHVYEASSRYDATTWNEKTGLLGSDSPIFLYVASYCFLLRSSYYQ